MSETWAVPSDLLSAANRTSTTGRPLCPACNGGYLHPYKVELSLSADPRRWQGGPVAPRGGHGATGLVGWVAVCYGNADEIANTHRLYEEAGQAPPDDDVVHPPCGFTMALTPQVDQWTRDTPLVPELPGGSV